MSVIPSAGTRGGKIKVLIVDDSALIRSVMKEIINSHPDLEVVGQAPDPITAREMIKQLNPDVLTLDVEMPRMNGLEFLEADAAAADAGCDGSVTDRTQQ